MRKTLIVSLCLVFALTTLTTAVALAKTDTGKKYADRTKYVAKAAVEDISDLPLDLQQAARPSLASAAADTFHLAWWGYEGNDPLPGWEFIDNSDQIGTFWHVDDFVSLSGYSPLEGQKSMWCGVRPGTAVPFCGYATLPGYGSNWIQYLISQNLDCDSVVIYYKVDWDSEPDFDISFVDRWDETSQIWVEIDDIDGGAGRYTAIGNLPVECLMFPATNIDTTTGVGNTQIRFRFDADGNTDDQDGGYASDGAIIIDSITVQCWDIEHEVQLDSSIVVKSNLVATFFEDFEGETVGATVTDDGGWTASVASGYVFLGAIYSGISVLQEDVCFTNTTKVYAFFDDPQNANYACGGFPGQGAIPFENDDGLYIANHINSPRIPFTGAGAQVVMTWIVYRDQALDNLVFYVWGVRTWIDDCPGPWRSDNGVAFGDFKDWIAAVPTQLGPFIDPGAEEIQVQLGVLDLCGSFCGVWGSGACHSHTPVFDRLHVKRVNVVGPQFELFGGGGITLFQDNFATDGTLTGHVRADMARDAAPGANFLNNLPGDSIQFDLSDPVSGLGFDHSQGDSTGPAAYVYVAVWPQGQGGKAGPELEAPELRYARTVADKRFPLVDSITVDGTLWYQFRADSVRNVTGTTSPGQFCFDLNDWVFNPCDTVCYILAATNSIGQNTYWSRRLNGQGGKFSTDDLAEALATPLEFTCLPAGGFKNGGDILYVDKIDDRGGPVQLFFDEAFAQLGLSNKHDRYDVIGPTSNVGNSLAGRVKNVNNQLIVPYQKIIWSTGTLTEGILGDGTGDPEKSPDFAVLSEFLNQHSNNPGLYINGENVASNMAASGAQQAVDFESNWINYTVVSPDHAGGIQAEPLSPILTAAPGAVCFIDSIEGPETYIAYGGCPQLLGRFDLMLPGAQSIVAFRNTASGNNYSLTQETTNAAASTARVMLEGHSFSDIREIAVQPIQARTVHLRNVLTWLSNVIDQPVGIGSNPKYANYLDENYPNPFNPTTTIKFGVKSRGHVSLKVYNVAGQLVKTLVNDVKTSGAYRVEWSGNNNAGQSVASGVYFYKLISTNFTQTKKMVLLK